MNKPLQSGAVLLLCLLLLMALSLLGLAAASDTQLQQRVSGNLQHRLDLDFTAQQALAWAEAWLMSLPGESRPVPCSESCSNSQVIRPAGYFSNESLTMNESWWQSHGIPSGFAPDRGMNFPVATAPGNLSAYWLVEQAHLEEWADPENHITELAWYRLTAMAGDSEGSFHVKQGIVARPWGEPSYRNTLPERASAHHFCDVLAPDIPCGRKAWQPLN
ncbi:MAG: hypothetical protein KJO85_04770 [Gammaproteobacteria bacterium]|nr:hypothetical protein [Gammaproteobacteria bacterium]